MELGLTTVSLPADSGMFPMADGWWQPTPVRSYVEKGLWTTYDEDLAMTGREPGWWEWAGVTLAKMVFPESAPSPVTVYSGGSRYIRDGGGPTSVDLMNQGGLILSGGSVILKAPGLLGKAIAGGKEVAVEIVDTAIQESLPVPVPISIQMMPTPKRFQGGHVGLSPENQKAIGDMLAKTRNRPLPENAQKLTFVGGNEVAPSAVGDTVPYFRVQGGTLPKASRQLIDVDAVGNVSIQPGTLNVSAGTAEHAQYFLQQRPGARVTTFEVPKWMDDFIQSEAIDQFKYGSNPLNQGGLAPKIVDPTTPGRSYELPGTWAEWLQEYAVPGSGRVH